MAKNNHSLRRFFMSIVLPAILAIGLYILSIFIVIIPSFEKNSMEGKKEMISELTNTACSLIEEYHEEVLNGKIGEDSARAIAIERVELIRYGDELKDYFWIIDRQPLMIMHPYRNDLIGKSLTTYEDSEGKLLFVEAKELVEKEGEGYIDYMWQWKDDSTRIVPKLSYVKGIDAWDWIVGTGVYLEDVHEEIGFLKRRLLRVALLITLVITIFLAFIIRQSLKIENERKEAEENLRLSREKYKSLVEASTEGTLMVIKDEIIFSNAKFGILSGYNQAEVAGKGVEGLFDLNWQKLVEAFDDPKKSLTREGAMKCKDGTVKEMVLSVSQIAYAGQAGHIIVVKEVSKHARFEKEGKILAAELQTSLKFMQRPVGTFVRKIPRCLSSLSVSEAAALMTRKKQSALFITQDDIVIGYLTDTLLRERILSKKGQVETTVAEVMNAPLIKISADAPVYEAMLTLDEEDIEILGVIDSSRKLSGMVTCRQLADIQNNNIAHLLREVQRAEDIPRLKELYRKIPVLTAALIEAGDASKSITSLVSRFADEVHVRVIELAIEEIGEPPCRFAFMVFGSQGRGEQTLATDQDNAILIEDSADTKAREYFLSIARKINKDLNTIGYIYCPGQNMALNSKWTCKLDTWKGYFSNWIVNSSPQDVLEVAIFFDFKCVYGHPDLVAQLRNHVNSITENKSVFLLHLAQSFVKFRPPSGLVSALGRKDPGQMDFSFDVKKVLMPVTGYLRLKALQHNIVLNNSLDRCEALFREGHIDAEMNEILSNAFNFLSYLRMKAQSEKISSEIQVDNELDLHTLNTNEILLLKRVVGDVSDLLTKVGFEFRVE